MGFLIAKFSPNAFAICIAALIAAVAVSGCASHKNTETSAKPSAPAEQSTNNTASNNAPSAPEAKIHISYAHPNDFLSSLIVTKYSGAENLNSIAASANGNASIIRFQGGVIAWNIAAQKGGLLNDVPMLRKDKLAAVTEVKYGVVPPNFTQLMPELGVPEPLEPYNFYVFMVTRASGSVSYDAVKVNGDGSLEAYDAEPRAGMSYKLCCNVSAG